MGLAIVVPSVTPLKCYVASNVADTNSPTTKGDCGSSGLFKCGVYSMKLNDKKVKTYSCAAEATCGTDMDIMGYKVKINCCDGDLCNDGSSSASGALQSGKMILFLVLFFM